MKIQAQSNDPRGMGLVLILICTTLGSACSKTEPCFPGSRGGQYRVTIVERYDENSRFSGGQHELLPCPTDLDLVNGSSFVVNIDHFNSEATSCSCGSGSAIEGPDGWVWNPSNEVGACQGSFFQGGAQATRDTCHARIRLFIDTKQLPSGSSVVGQAPVAWAQRDFYAGYADGGTTTCPVDGPSCSDHFVVEITNQ